MRYFSPSIPDGSVTTAKIAANAVTLSKISTMVDSQAGTILAQGRVTIFPDFFSFMPAIEGDQPTTGALDMSMIAVFNSVPDALPDDVKFALHNRDTGSARNYSVAWRAFNSV